MLVPCAGGPIARSSALIVTKRGLAAALHPRDPAFAALPAYFQQHLGPALRTLLDNAAAAGAIRDGAIRVGVGPVGAAGQATGPVTVTSVP